MRRSVLLAGGMVMILLLAGAAFVGGRLLSRSDPTGDPPDVIVSRSGDAVTTSGYMLDQEPAPEMPAAPADVAGLFVRREDNRLFVGTGNMSGVKVGDRWELHHDGPVLEVLATHETLVYRDDTLQQLDGDPPSGPVQQVLKPGSLDELGATSTLLAWGEKRGQRLFADVVVYSNPVVSRSQ
jgi:hypothetical protein